MQHLISALQFITIIPVGGSFTFNPRQMVRYFPIVGLILGSLLSAVDLVATHLWSVQIASLVDVLFLAIITGAFHLDGVGDTADGLFSHRGRDRALEIMKDSRIGMMALVAVVAVLAVKWGGIAGLHPHRSLILILVPAYARAAMLFGMRFLPYGREDGTGQAFFNEPLNPTDFWGLIIPAALSVFLGWTGLWLNLWFLILTAAVIRYYKKQMGCITGDMLGAMTEVTESLLFLIVSVGVLL